MSEREGRRRARRTLRPDEHALWHAVTQSVSPLRGRKPRQAAPDAPAAPPPPAPAGAVGPAPPVAAKPVRKSASPPPALTPLDRRTRQRVARGSRSIEARLDLHGLTQQEAHNALLNFLRRAQRDDARLVLVITGKGARTGDHLPYGERGVLRRLAPHWLESPEFRPYVLGFEAAHVTHGGEGALYVRVRRK